MRRLPSGANVIKPFPPAGRLTRLPSCPAAPFPKNSACACLINVLCSFRERMFDKAAFQAAPSILEHRDAVHVLPRTVIARRKACQRTHDSSSPRRHVGSAGNENAAQFPSPISRRIKPNQGRSSQPSGARQTAEGCPKGEAGRAESNQGKKISPLGAFLIDFGAEAELCLMKPRVPR
jgi:hypothetical protein